MARINTLSVEGDKKKGFTVTAMTDDGTLLEIKEGFEFCSIESYHLLEDTSDEIQANLRSELERLRAELGQLQQQLAAKPAETRAPMLHREYQAIPVGRTLDNLPPIDALAAAPAIPEPVIRTELGADAPARPPGPGEMMKIHTTDPVLAHEPQYDEEGRPIDTSYTI